MAFVVVSHGTQSFQSGAVGSAVFALVGLLLVLRFAVLCYRVVSRCWTVLQ